MFQKIKNFVGTLIMALTIRLFFTSKSKKLAQKAKVPTLEQADALTEELKKEVSMMPEDQKALFSQYAKLQNELFKIFITYTREIQKAKDGGQMDSVAGIWITTCEGLNKTLTLAFTHQSDDKIKAHLHALEKELQLAIDTNQEILGSNKFGGGFGYSGPIGEA